MTEAICDGRVGEGRAHRHDGQRGVLFRFPPLQQPLPVARLGAEPVPASQSPFLPSVLSFPLPSVLSFLTALEGGELQPRDEQKEQAASETGSPGARPCRSSAARRV